MKNVEVRGEFCASWWEEGVVSSFLKEREGVAHGETGEEDRLRQRIIGYVIDGERHQEPW